MRQRKNSAPPAPGSAQGAALRALGRREHSARELVAKLRQRGYDASVAAGAVEQLAEKDLQSDTRYAELLVRSRIAQGYGPLRIKAELGVAGVSDAQIEQAVAQALANAECDWRALAAQAHARKFGTPPVDITAQQQQYRYLAARGFSSEHIRSVLKGEIE